MEIRIGEAAPVQQADAQGKQARRTAEDFGFTLRRLGDEGLAERVGELINEIRTQGEKIARHTDIRDMRVYRALIGDFINEIVANSYTLTRKNVIDRRGHHRPYNLVWLVNKDLDELARELLKEEKDNLAILDKIGEIQGLLLDMLV